MSILKKIFQKNRNKTQVFEISLPKIEEMFDQIQQQAGWDTSEKLYWGYYFLDHDSEKLQSFGKILKKEGYTIVEIRHTGRDSIFLLHAEEHVVHTPESLIEQFHTLSSLANQNDIEVLMVGM